jgi:hypothetical protein
VTLHVPSSVQPDPGEIARPISRGTEDTSPADDLERLRRAAERANALQQITEALARPIEYGEVVEAIVYASVHALRARAGAVFEMRADRDPAEFHLAKSLNLDP